MLVKFKLAYKNNECRDFNYMIINDTKILYVQPVKQWGSHVGDYYKVTMTNSMSYDIDKASFENYLHGINDKDKNLTIWQKIKIFFAGWLKSLKTIKS